MDSLRGGQKVDLVKCLPNPSTTNTASRKVDAVILDGAVIVQMLPPKTALTFEEYFGAVFAPYVMKQLESVISADLVLDVYV